MESSPYKPSPLSLNSSRASPFRRPSSPSSTPSTVVGRPSTPPYSSPGKNGHSPVTSPSKLKQSFTPSEEHDRLRPHSTRSQTEPPPSPTARGLPEPPSHSDDLPRSRGMNHVSDRLKPMNGPSSSDNLSRLPPQLLHSLREAFSVLDRSNSGTISQSDVEETLSSLGIADSSTFFPPGSPQRLSLPQFLSQLANILVDISAQQELSNAFSAFDDDDSGQVDVAELGDALLHTAPAGGDRGLCERDVEAILGTNSGFTGRRVFPKTATGMAGLKTLGASAGIKKTGNVFRYQEFVGNLTGAGNGQNGNGQDEVQVGSRS